MHQVILQIGSLSSRVAWILLELATELVLSIPAVKNVCLLYPFIISEVL